MASPASIAALPAELVVFVLNNLDRLKDISALARADRKLYNTINPILYKRAVSQGDVWPLAWAAHCGVTGTLRKALAAGANPNHQFVDGLPVDEWKRANAVARQAVAETGDSDVWETENECESNVDFEADESEHISDGDDKNDENALDTNQPLTSSSSDPWRSSVPYIPFFTDSDRDSDVSMDEITAPSDSASSTLDDHDHEQFVEPVVSGAGAVLRRFNPLHLAARAGHNSIIEILLDYGAPINAFSECLCDCTRLYGLLNAAECPENDHFPPSWSPLHIAICHGHTDTAKLLLSRGASYMMELPTDYGESPYLNHSATALHHAAAAGLVDLVRYLLEKGIQAVVDVRDDKTLTPFYHAYANRRWDTTVPLLLELGANVDVDTKLFLPYSTITPLGESCRMGNFEEADRLIDLGADVTRGYVSTTTGRGLSPLHMSSMPSAQPVSEIPVPRVYEERERGIRRMKTIAKLIARGALIDLKDCSGDSPLIAAAQHHNVPGLRALIKAGANIHQQNAVGRTALMQAIIGVPNPVASAQNGSSDVLAQILQELLAGGARLDDTDSEGNTVLHLVFKGANKSQAFQKGALRLLLNKPSVSALLEVRNKDNQLPLQVAFQARNLEACEVLVRRGCPRGGLDQAELSSMFEDALVNLGDQATLDFVLDLDVNGYLTSDPSLFSTLITKGGYFAVRAAHIISERGLPSLPPRDYTRLLCQAIRLGELFLAYSLLEAGADVNAPNAEGQYPLALFIRNTFVQSRLPIKASSAHQFLQALLDRGANHHVQFDPSSPERVLNRVIGLELEEALILMLKTQPLANDTRAANGFYLHGAVTITSGQRPSSEKIIDILLASGPDLGEINGDGDTPLSVLLKCLCKERRFTWRYHRFIKALMCPSVDINRHNNDGRSIADYLQELMYPKDGGPGQTTFLTRRIQLVETQEGVKSLRFLPRPRKRIRPTNVMASNVLRG